MKLTKTTENLQAVAPLVAYAFNKNHDLTTDELFTSRFNHAESFVQVTNQQVTSLVMANEFVSQFYATPLKMAGVGYVASFPEYRGDGSVGALMRELLTTMYEQGYAMSNLAPFAQPFYRRFGYEQTMWQKKYVLQAAAFQTFPSEKSGKVVRDTWENLQAVMKQLHRELIQDGTQTGTLHREDWWWTRLDQYYQHRHYAVAYDGDNQPVGYLIYRMIGATFYIDECAYTSTFALRRLLTFVKAHVSSFTEFIYLAPEDEILEHLFGELAQITITRQPYMMSRIVDFTQVIQALPLPENVAWVFRVTADETCPWNVGTWRVHGQTCEKISDDESNVHLAGDIQAWSSLLFGSLTVAEGLRLEKFTSEAAAVVRPIFPEKNVRFYDYF